MAGTGRSLTPRGRFAVRAGILAGFALVAGAVGAITNQLDDGEASHTEVLTTQTPGATPSTGTGARTGNNTKDKEKDGKNEGKDDGKSQPDRVPSGVTSGIGDDVRLASINLLAARSLVGTPDVAALDRLPAASGLASFSWPGEGALAWRAGRFTEIASGNEYGTRSLLGPDGLEPRRILWVTLRDGDTGLRISFVRASLETGGDAATEAANAAYGQRVRDLTNRLSRTSSVVLSTSAGARHSVAVPSGNVRPGQVVALRAQRPVAGGSSARIAVQSSGH